MILRINSRKWFSTTIIVMGLGALTIFTLWSGHQSARHTSMAVESLFPAALQVRDAQASFLIMLRCYRDGAAQHDEAVILQANKGGSAVELALERSASVLPEGSQRRRQAEGLTKEFKDYQQRTEKKYSKVLLNFNKLSENDDPVIEEYGRDQQKVKDSLSLLNDDLAHDFETELAATGAWSRRQSITNLALMLLIIAAALKTVTSMTESAARKRDEENIRALHRETELFLNSVPSLLIGLNTDGLITKWNLSAAAIFRMQDSDVLGRRLDDCGIKWILGPLETLFVERLDESDHVRLDKIRFERDGEIRFLGMNAIRVINENGAREGTLIVGADITSRIALEEQLKQAQKLEAIGQLAAGVAHEINTPTQYVGDNVAFLKETWDSVSRLVAWCGDTDVSLKRGEDPSPEAFAKLQELIAEADLEFTLSQVPRALEESLDGLKRVASIVRAMKEFSHPGSSEMVHVDINKAIETTVTVARNELKYVADVELNLQSDLPLVPCLAGEINQVILNLLVNAAHAIDKRRSMDGTARGKIDISTSHGDKFAEIRIRDSGSGIPESIRGRVFEPFFTTKEVGKGTGQGLALAHNVIVKKHGGKIWFETEVGIGTTFIIQLPLAPVPA